MAKQRKIVRTEGDRSYLSAAAETINLNEPIYSASGNRQFTQDWQKRAWQMADEIGEASNAMNYMGDAFSQLRLWIGANVENELVELNPEKEADIPQQLKDIGVTPERIIQAQDVLDALNYPHGLPEIQRMYGMGLFQVGETYLVGRENEEGDEEWDTYSTEQVFVNTNNRYAIRASPSDQVGKELNAETDFILRTWKRDARWPQLATSSIKAALMILEELLLLTYEVRAIVSSRIPAGIVIFPNSIEMLQNDLTSDDPSQNGSSSQFLTEVQKHITTAITTPGSAAAAAPILMKADAADIAAITEVKFGRDLSPVTLEHRKEAIERFAAAINLPGEVLLGKGGLNHWSAWLINTEALNNHIQPLAKIMTYGLTHRYLLPRLSLDINGDPVEDVLPFVIGFEMSTKLDDPEKTKMEMWAYEQITLISENAMRARLDIKDEEKPDDAEVARRIAMAQTKAPAIPSEGKAPPADPTTIASGAPQIVKKLKLSSAERELRVRLQVAADQAMTRALEKAGAKLRSLARGDKVAKEKIAASNVSNEMLISKFPELLLSLNHTPDALLAGAFDQYGDYWDENVDDAEDQFLNIVGPGLSTSQLSAARNKYATARASAKLAIVAGLTAKATELIYDPSPDAPLRGEYESSMRIPAGLIRNSLILAGGGSTKIDQYGSPMNLSGVPESGLFTTPISSELLVQSTAVTVEAGYTWVYGDESSRNGHPFEPHVELEGESFSSWDDPVLDVGADDWVDSSNGCFRPGDHDGCQCDYESNITANEGADDGEPV